jgi:hypothetical protein
MRILSFILFYFTIVSCALSQTSSLPGVITGDDVFLRSDHTTQSKAIKTLDKGQRVFIISSFRPKGNDNEAILRVSTDFFDEDYGVKLFTLPKGKAVVVNGLENDRYRISFRNDKSGRVGFAKIDTHRLEFIGGETWYHVEVNNMTGWVFGKYVAYY